MNIKVRAKDLRNGSKFEYTIVKNKSKVWVELWYDIETKEYCASKLTSGEYVRYEFNHCYQAVDKFNELVKELNNEA